jgi:class 3 adenylate cyclase
MEELSEEAPTRNSHPEFERLRQDQETRNEKIVNYIQLTVFIWVLIANIATHSKYVTFVPYKAPASLFVLISISLIARIIIYLYLRRDPVYRTGRKYVISMLDVSVYTGAAVILGAHNAYPFLFLSLFAVCTYSMLVALSGLRYSTRIVIFNGIVTALLSVAVFASRAPLEFRGPVAMVALLTIGCVTVCTAYSVASLIRIHKDASIKENLARFLPPELVEKMMEEPDLLLRKTEKRTATVIFTDIRGFTRYSEIMTPERVVEFLNDFLQEMTEAIMDHKGMVDKYIGDAVMGVFGVPFFADDHAIRALRSAIDMRDRVKEMNKGLKQRGLPELSVGIGLHTGELLIGAIGSTRRLDYTVIGDTVNVASRIEGLTRSYPVEILVSDSSRNAIGDAIMLYPIATVQVKNRVEPLAIWSPDLPSEIIGESSAAGAA